MKLKNLYREQNLFLFLLDLFMLLLISLNFLLILADWLFVSAIVNDFLLEQTPAFHAVFNKYIHRPFLFYDLIFVSLYVTELLIRWGWAIWTGAYVRWYFYPFVHWYDVLGCLPVSSFRLLRFLRFFSMLYRLQQFEVIDLRKTYLYKIGLRFFEIFVEEVSDRVVVNVLESVQSELKKGNPVTDRIVNEVVRPHKEEIVEWMAKRMQRATAESYERHRELIRTYLYQRVTESVDKNWEVSLIDRFPVLGGVMTDMLENAVADIVFQVIDRIVADLATNPRNVLMDEITDLSFEALLLIDEDKELNRIITSILDQSIEEVKAHVRIQQWKVKLEEERLQRRQEADNT